MRDDSPRARRNAFGQRTRLRGEVVHPQLGNIDDDAPLRRARQHVERRDRDLRAFAGQPLVDAGIRLPQLLVTDVVGASQRYEGVFVARLDDLYLAEDLVAFADPELGRLRRRGAEDAGQDQPS